MIRPLVIYVLAFFAALMLMPSAQAQTPELKIALAEGRFVAETQASCVDLVEAKASHTAAKQSVEPNGFYFSSLSLEWASPDILMIDSLRAAITDEAGHRAVLELPVDEVKDLLANETATLKGPVTVVSNDAVRDQNPKYARCGVAYGGVNWLDRSRKLNIIFTAIGAVETANGDLRPIEVSTLTEILPAQ
jgi:hypothetical protein